MTKEKRNENLTVIGVITYLIIILFASVIIASKIGTIGDYSNLAEKATNITSLEEIIQKANSVEISNNVVTAIYQEKTKELEVSYNLNTCEIIETKKSFCGIMGFAIASLALFIFIVIVLFSIFIVCKIDNIRNNRRMKKT